MRPTIAAASIALWVGLASAADSTAVWQDSTVTAAAPPNSLWNSVVFQNAQMKPWGKQAVSPNVIVDTTTYDNVVYVIDVGVGRHTDLNVVEWVSILETPNVVCGTRPMVAGLPSCGSLWSKVIGSYSHGTAVAGVIGAKANATGVLGIQPGAHIVSVRAMANRAQYDPAMVAKALNWVHDDIWVHNHTGQPSVVNLSLNWANFKDSSEVMLAIHDLITKTPDYIGAVVVQSAGNNFIDACSEAYVPPGSNVAVANDGVLVVGAINNHGQPVVPLNAVPGFWKDVGGVVHQPGSNFGKCVDAWAPGDAIFSTMGEVTTQNPSLTYETYGYMSGTSLAAPHVAGLVAYLIEHDATLTSPGLVEQALRSNLASWHKFVDLGSQAPGSATPSAMHTANGVHIMLPTLTPPAGAKNTPYAEFLVRKAKCMYPMYVTMPSGCNIYNMMDGITPPNQAPYLNDAPFLLANDFAPNRGALSKIAAHHIWLSFDSYGVSSGYTCDVKYSQNGSLPATLFSAGQRYFLSDAPYASSTTFSSSCPSASISVTVTP